MRVTTNHRHIPRAIHRILEGLKSHADPAFIIFEALLEEYECRPMKTEHMLILFRQYCVAVDAP